MPVQYSSRSEIAVSHIRDQILSGQLQAGERINQSELARELNISLIPLREALKQLEGEGYLEVVSYSGVFVKRLDQEELEDLYLIRREIEALTATLALERVSESVTNKMSDLLDKMKEATKKLDYKRLLSLNRAFHYALYEASKREFLLAILEDLWNRSSRYRILGTFHPDRAQGALEEHREILEHSLAGDSDLLAAAIKTNIENTLEFLKKECSFETEE